MAVDGTKDIVTLPPRSASHEYPFKAPEHAHDCPHHEMSSIDEDFTLSLARFVQLCSVPRSAVEIVVVWAVASSLYTVGITTLCRVILC